MHKLTRAAMFAVLAAGLSAPAFAGDPSGTYKRKNGDTVKVWIDNNLLYCKITEGKRPGFEMCHGMSKDGDAWKGSAMKHPGMPGFMTFNGTVTSDAGTINIKGCAIGQSMCDSEVWTRVQ